MERYLTILARLMILLLASSALYACTRGVKEASLLPSDPVFTMAIASDSSDFKDSLRERVIQHYRKESSIDVVNIKALKTIDPADYDVVVVMDTCLAWSSFNPSLNNFLEQHAPNDNVVLFMTAGDPDWAYSYQGVDAITSASVMEHEDVKFDEIIEQIDRVLAENGKKT